MIRATEQFVNEWINRYETLLKEQGSVGDVNAVMEIIEILNDAHNTEDEHSLDCFANDVIYNKYKDRLSLNNSMGFILDLFFAYDKKVLEYCFGANKDFSDEVKNDK